MGLGCRENLQINAYDRINSRPAIRMCGDCDKVYEKDPVYVEIFNRLANGETGDERVAAYKEMEDYIWDFQSKNPLCEVAKQALSDESDDDLSTDPNWIAIKNRAARARTDREFLFVKLEMEDYLETQHRQKTDSRRNFDKRECDAESSEDEWGTDDDSEAEFIEAYRASKVVRCAYDPTNSSRESLCSERANSEVLEKEENRRNRSKHIN